MNNALSNKVLAGIAVALALLWTLGLGITYALLGYTGEVTHWVNDLLGIQPDVAGWLASAGTWVEEWGGWLLVALWLLGLLALALAALFARRIVQWFHGARHEGMA